MTRRSECAAVTCIELGCTVAGGAVKIGTRPVYPNCFIRLNLTEAVQSNIIKFCSFIDDRLPHKVAGYDVTSCFQLVADWIEILAESGKINPASVPYIIVLTRQVRDFETVFRRKLFIVLVAGVLHQERNLTKIAFWLWVE